MHILITGHQGYIGPVAVALAQARGHRVTGLDIGYFKDCGTGPKPEREIVRDIREVEARDLDGIDAVLHLAGLSNDPMGQLDPDLTRAINRGGTKRLADLAKAVGVGRFVFASSCSLYGAAGGDTAVNETAPMAPVSAYAESKAASESDLLALADEAFSPVLLRNATAYGIGPRPRFDLVVNNLAGHAYRDGVVKVMSDGTPWRPLAHIEDIALAALCALEAPREAVHAEAFNIGQPQSNHQVSEIAETVAHAFPGARLEVTGEAGGDPRSYRVDFTKALTRLPGFKPRWTMGAGVEEAARWLREGGLGGEDFTGPRFIRLAALKGLIARGEIDGALRRVR